MNWVVIVTADDGTKSVTGTFESEYGATLWANDHENEESGWLCDVVEMEKP